MRRLDYHRCATVSEALETLDRLGAAAKVVAGGTDILVDMEVGRIRPGHLADISFVPELGGVEPCGESLVIGATVTHDSLVRSPHVSSRAPCLAEAAGQVGSPQVRNIGTLGGNLASAVPSADLAPPAIALDASLTLLGPAGERTVRAADFFTGPRTTILAANEILASVRIPGQPPRLGTKFLKFGRRKAMSLAVVNVAVAIALDEALARIGHVRIALGAVAPVPLRAAAAEAALLGQEPRPEAIEAAAEAACSEIRPIDDIRASAGYRREITRVLVRRALMEALERAGFRGRLA